MLHGSTPSKIVRVGEKKSDSYKIGTLTWMNIDHIICIHLWLLQNWWNLSRRHDEKKKTKEKEVYCEDRNCRKMQNEENYQKKRRIGEKCDEVTNDSPRKRRKIHEGEGIFTMNVAKSWS